MAIQDQDVVMKLIVPAGSARSTALGALEQARGGNFDAAKAAIEQAREQINEAHEFQSEIIREALNASGETDSGSVSLIMAHGQDHLMNAIVICDLAEQIVQITKALAPRA